MSHDLRKTLITKGRPTITMPPLPKTSSSSSSGSGNYHEVIRAGKNYTPVSWKNYFHNSTDVQVSNGTIRVYRRGAIGPLLVLIHGGGFSALTWSLFTKTICESISCQTLAFDLRGHGDTQLQNESDLSMETLINDLVEMMHKIFPDDDSPPLVIVGHSLGGAVGVRLVADGRVKNIVALVVIDVVEGSALESLSSMSLVLAGRPKKFKSIDKAVQWCVSSAMIRNIESARVSFPGQLIRVDNHATVISELDAGRLLPGYESIGEQVIDDMRLLKTASSIPGFESLCEEDETGGGGAGGVSNSNSKYNIGMPAPHKLPPLRGKSGGMDEETASSSSITTTPHELTWRIDLNKTSSFWQGWFKGLNAQFLSVPVPKLVVLAGVDRLDKDLTIGQMQGKFQMNLLQNCGHIIHEDVPHKFCEILATFLIRNKFVNDSSAVNK